MHSVPFRRNDPNYSSINSHLKGTAGFSVCTVHVQEVCKMHAKTSWVVMEKLPLSLISRFAPSLKVLSYTGGKEEREKQRQEIGDLTATRSVRMHVPCTV